MSLANMRGLGLTSVEAVCKCGRESIIDLSSLSETVEVSTLRLSLYCSASGSRPAFVRPNWQELWAPGLTARPSFSAITQCGHGPARGAAPYTCSDTWTGAWYACTIVSLGKARSARA